MNQYSELLYFLKGLAEDNQFVNTVTKGSVDKIDLERANIYPLFHIDINDAGFTNGSTITFEVTLTCLNQRDINKEIVEDDKFWSNDNEVDNHNETLAILNDVWLRILRDWEDKDITTEDNATLQKIEFSKGNILDGWSLEFTVELPNTTISLCDGSPELGYGLLYNYPSVIDVRNIANDGWHVPTIEEMNILKTTIDDGDSATGGVKMKTTDMNYWFDYGQTAHTNTSKFSGRGSGTRQYDGVFKELKSIAYYRTTSLSATNNSSIGSLTANFDSFNVTTNQGSGIVTEKETGASVRPLKDSTSLSDGETGTYIGNDGKVYETICIGTQEWLSQNLSETLYRDGSEIPTVTDATEWANLTTGAKCAYDNDESNV